MNTTHAANEGYPKPIVSITVGNHEVEEKFRYFTYNDPTIYRMVKSGATDREIIVALAAEKEAMIKMRIEQETATSIAIKVFPVDGR